ncbi:MAG TPA: hypothetical protein DCW74_12105 [Alteromonas australica]|uniref:PEP-CTERM sorting domain-containing protein n=1 Tax=Alteromonas australica TaxID=589873 RepID=A0A358E030_9ALTE|nr:choice-of-anchor E domain-containing protein [Alteromonas australica]HAW76461.1 hypothetical protein [Alteromonas australica]HBU51808.1 hypothetical protein [Alteromonas australica]|tara:strand:+ start:73 stop:840 length:768 start_codon:yes stop_codon:yes gene_type:complete
MDKRLGIGTLALTGILVSGALNAATIIGSGSTDAQVDFVDFYNSSGGLGEDGVQDFGTPGVNPNFDTFFFEQFDTMGGTRVLTSAVLTLDGEIMGQAQAENEDGLARSDIDFSALVTLTLSSPSNNALLTVNPRFSESFLAETYDGTTDFSGTSGVTYAFSSDTDAASETVTDEAILSDFIGNGTVSLGLDATSVLEALFTGGDVTSEIFADATARSTLVYNYDVVDVSAPGTFIMMGCALGVVGFSNRKRAEKA